VRGTPPADDPHGDEPEPVILDDQTQTRYAADEAGNSVSATGGSRCNVAVTRYCLPRLEPSRLLAWS
jgi:hypothetical protein